MNKVNISSARIEQEGGRGNTCFPVEEGSERSERRKTVGFRRVR